MEFRTDGINKNNGIAIKTGPAYTGPDTLTKNDGYFKKLIMAVIMAASCYGRGGREGALSFRYGLCYGDSQIWFAAPGSYPSAVAGDIAMLFEGISYESAMRTDSAGMLQLRLDAFDEMSFVNTVGALSKTAVRPGVALGSGT